MSIGNHYKRNYSRPRIQRPFLLWFAESRRRFAVPLRIARHRKQSIELEFTRAKSLIRATLTSWEINVGFDWQGACWDLLICFEAIPELTRNGYVCSLCNPEQRDTYTSRDQLWRKHLFEPFLTWVNDTLTKAPWIEIYGCAGRLTAVKLLDSFPENQCSDLNCRIIGNPLYVPNGGSQ